MNACASLEKEKEEKHSRHFIKAMNSCRILPMIQLNRIGVCGLWFSVGSYVANVHTEIQCELISETRYITLHRSASYNNNNYTYNIQSFSPFRF